MAAPQPPPSWWETLIGGGAFGALFIKGCEWARTSLAKLRRENAQVVVAKIESEDAFVTSILARIKDLETRDDERTKREFERDREYAKAERGRAEKMNAVERQLDHVRADVRRILERMESALSGDPAQVIALFREMISEMRGVIDQAQAAKAIPIGDHERHQGDSA